jgi:cold shock CspA family protein
MSAGTIIKLVTSYGSDWGRIQPEGEERGVFFNAETLVDPTLYADLVVGQEVEFDEEPDRANATHAVRVRLRLVEAIKS